MIEVGKEFLKLVLAANNAESGKDKGEVVEARDELFDYPVLGEGVAKEEVFGLGKQRLEVEVLVRILQDHMERIHCIKRLHVVLAVNHYLKFPLLDFGVYHIFDVFREVRAVTLFHL